MNQIKLIILRKIETIVKTSLAAITEERIKTERNIDKDEARCRVPQNIKDVKTQYKKERSSTILSVDRNETETNKSSVKENEDVDDSSLIEDKDKEDYLRSDSVESSSADISDEVDGKIYGNILHNTLILTESKGACSNQSEGWCDENIEKQVQFLIVDVESHIQAIKKKNLYLNATDGEPHIQTKNLIHRSNHAQYLVDSFVLKHIGIEFDNTQTSSLLENCPPYLKRFEGRLLSIKGLLPKIQILSTILCSEIRKSNDHILKHSMESCKEPCKFPSNLISNLKNKFLFLGITRLKSENNKFKYLCRQSRRLSHPDQRSLFHLHSIVNIDHGDGLYQFPTDDSVTFLFVHTKLNNCGFVLLDENRVDLELQMKEIITCALKCFLAFQIKEESFTEEYGSMKEQVNTIPKYRLVVVPAEIFENAMRQYQIENYELTFTNYFPSNCRMFIGIPVYKGGLINRRDIKDRS